MEETIRVLDRAVEILQAFSFANEEQSLSEICKKVHLPKTTVFRIINSLESKNILVQNSETGHYRLGYELIKLGAIAQNGNELSKVAKKTLFRVSCETKQTSNLYIRDGYERVCIAQCMGSEYVRRYSFLGAHLPLYCGAGKLLLAYASEDFLNTYLSNIEIEKFTENTVTDKRELQDELNEIRKNRFAVSRGERDPVTAVVTVPIYDYTKSVIAGLTVSGPTYSFTEETVKQYLEVLNREAKKLSQKLGYE